MLGKHCLWLFNVGQRRKPQRACRGRFPTAPVCSRFCCAKPTLPGGLKTLPYDGSGENRSAPVGGGFQPPRCVAVSAMRNRRRREGKKTSPTGL